MLGNAGGGAVHGTRGGVRGKAAYGTRIEVRGRAEIGMGGVVRGEAVHGARRQVPGGEADRTRGDVCGNGAAYKKEQHARAERWEETLRWKGAMARFETTTDDAEEMDGLLLVVADAGGKI